jgi:hypothetical protein
MTSRTFVWPLAAAVLSFCAVMPAQSASIKNLDATEHKVVVVEGQTRQEHMVPGQQELTSVCTKVCSVYVGADPEPIRIGKTSHFLKYAVFRNNS